MVGLLEVVLCGSSDVVVIDVGGVCSGGVEINQRIKCESVAADSEVVVVVVVAVVLAEVEVVKRIASGEPGIKELKIISNGITI